MASLFSKIASHAAGKRPLAPGLPAEGAPAAEERAAVAREALALARQLLHSVEQFIISTTDLDGERLLHRLRATAAGLTSQIDRSTVQLYGKWATSALGSFAALQRRYVAEREDEMWRLLEAYAQASASGQERTAAFLADVSESHGRLRELACLPDIREARQQLEEELRRTNRLVEQKAQEDKDRMAALGRQVARLEHELAAVRGRADYDVLTGVLHRGAIERRLCALLAEGKPCTLAMLDLDNFKTVNDTLGHQIGDRLLTLVAEQLHRVTRAGDAVGRYGGDEFLFVAPGLNPEHLAQRLSTAVARRHVRLELEGRTVSVLLSLTVGITASRVGDDLPVVLERADRAMLSLKKAGKGGIRFASPEGPPPPAARLPEPITGGTG